MSAPAVPIVMCVWKRAEKLPETLAALSRQTDTAFELYLWNNNPAAAGAVDAAVGGRHPFRVHAHHHPTNVGGYGRFLYVREMLKGRSPSHVIFIDDDLDFGEDLVERLRAEARPRTIVSSYAYRFYRASASYKDRLDIAPGEEAHYCGTGGMIADASVFADDRLFELERLPGEFLFVEDLWLSHFCIHVLGWKCVKSGLKAAFRNDGKDLSVELAARGTKDRLFRRLRKTGWLTWRLYPPRDELLSLRKWFADLRMRMGGA